MFGFTNLLENKFLFLIEFPLPLTLSIGSEFTIYSSKPALMIKLFYTNTRSNKKAKLHIIGRDCFGEINAKD